MFFLCLSPSLGSIYCPCWSQHLQCAGIFTIAQTVFLWMTIAPHCIFMNGFLAFHYTLGIPVLLHDSKPQCLSSSLSVLKFPLPPRLNLNQWPLVIPSPASSTTLWTMHFSCHQPHCHPGDSYILPSLPASLRCGLAHLWTTVSVCGPEDFPEDCY